MEDLKTPDWLVETQNKSWEPEIIISGITLTFLFILSNYIFNFYGMLIQELNVRHVVGRNLYIVSTIILTGLKVGLISHLVLRGLWTAFVGLSYVFPKGVNKQNMPVSKRKIDFLKPEDFVIKLEKICSLLFSFIFSSIIFVGSFCIGMIPFALLYMLGLDPSIIKTIILYIILPFYMAIAVFWIILVSRKKNSRFINRTENSIFSNILTTYFTNMGKKKTFLIFILYFILITTMSYSDILKFDFDNRASVNFTRNHIVNLNKDHYENNRDIKIRISKAAIGQFWVSEKSIDLFISFYKEDVFSVQNLKSDKASLKGLEFKVDTNRVDLKTLYQIYIDEQFIADTDWYEIKKGPTEQRGLMARISINDLSRGLHILKIDKLYWVEKKKKIKLIESWDIIPFSLQ